MHFIIQYNINKQDYKELIESIESQGHTFESFFHIPFDTSYPTLSDREDIFVYAASSVTDNIRKNYFYYKGVFNHTSNINLINYYANSVELMWSKCKFIGKISEFLKLEVDFEDVFSRPVLDNKLFSGQVCSHSELINMFKLMVKVDEKLNDEMIFIGEVDQPEYEYRLFMIDGEVAASSKYRVDGFVYPTEGCPDEVKEFAVNFNSVNILPKACVIDIGTKGNKIGVIEVNSIHNSGFYHCNKNDIISALAKFIENK